MGHVLFAVLEINTYYIKKILLWIYFTSCTLKEGIFLCVDTYWRFHFWCLKFACLIRKLSLFRSFLSSKDCIFWNFGCKGLLVFQLTIQFYSLCFSVFVFWWNQIALCKLCLLKKRICACCIFAWKLQRLGQYIDVGSGLNLVSQWPYRPCLKFCIYHPMGMSGVIYSCILQL